MCAVSCLRSAAITENCDCLLQMSFSQLPGRPQQRGLVGLKETSILNKTFLVSHPSSLVLHSGHTVLRRRLWPHWWVVLRELIS